MSLKNIERDRRMLARNWWEIHEEVVDFSQWFFNITTHTVGDVLDFIEKPWKWDPEYQEWRKAGRP